MYLQVICKVAKGTKEDVDYAVACAKVCCTSCLVYH